MEALGTPPLWLERHFSTMTGRGHAPLSCFQPGSSGGRGSADAWEKGWETCSSEEAPLVM